jgi:hypothetical protein
MRLGKREAAGYVADIETDEIPGVAEMAPLAESGLAIAAESATGEIAAESATREPERAAVTG